MGSFLVTYGNMVIKPKYREKFEKQLLKVATAGGMMNISRVNMFDKNVYFLKFLKMPSNTKYNLLEFDFNYYESRSWESAGYNIDKGYVWSNKVGYSKFNRCLHSLYILMETYPEVEGFIGGDIYCDNEIILDWLKSILKEPLDLKNRRDPAWIYNLLKQDEYREIDYIGDVNEYLMPNCHTASIMKQIFSERSIDDAMIFFGYKDRDDEFKEIDWKNNSNFSLVPVILIIIFIIRVADIRKKYSIDDNFKTNLFQCIDKVISRMNEVKKEHPFQDWEELETEKNPILKLSLLVHYISLDIFIKLVSHEFVWNEEELLERYKNVDIYYPTTSDTKKIDNTNYIVTTANLYAYDDNSNMALFWQDDGDFDLPDHFWQDFNIVKEKFKEIKSSTSEVTMSSIELIKLALDTCSDLNERMNNIMLIEETFYWLIDDKNKDISVPLLKLLDYYSEKLSVWFEKTGDFVNNLFYLKMKQIVAMVCNKHLLKYLLK